MGVGVGVRGVTGTVLVRVGVTVGVRVMVGVRVGGIFIVKLRLIRVYCCAGKDPPNRSSLSLAWM